MDDAPRDVVDLSTVVGTVSTALLTCNSPNYTKNKTQLLTINFYMFFTSTTTAIKYPMILIHVLKSTFLYWCSEER